MKTILYIKISSLLFFFSLTCISLSAQDYTFALGGRVGSERGISLKHFHAPNFATEGMFVHHKNGLHIIGMIECQFELGRKTDFYFIGGVGGHAGYQNLLNPERANTPMVGVDAMVGFEYIFPYIPLAFSFDIKPQVEMLQEIRLSGNHAAVSLRYLID